jgi:2-octaprenyl-6-methoxyphenol hydroxylase
MTRGLPIGNPRVVFAKFLGLRKNLRSATLLFLIFSMQLCDLDRSSLPKALESVDVAIAGGGIVGLTLACALKDSGLRVALIEAKPVDAGLQQRRAYAITLMSGRIFQGLGLWEKILPQIATFGQIRLADSDCPAVVDLQPKDLRRQAGLGYVGEHFVFIEALLNQLQTAKNITWYSPAELVDVTDRQGEVELTLERAGQIETLRSQLLIAADGARSPIRQRAGIKTRGWQYWQSCITAVITSEKAHGNIAREHFWASGPFATLPLPDNRCQIVLTAPHAEAEHWMQVSDAEFLAELDRRYAGQLGQLSLLSPRFRFPVQLMQSDRYVAPRLALVGDAAHCCHPVGGQGMNQGIRDAAAIAEVLLTAHQRGEDLGSLRVLKRYERWRKSENWIILGFTDFLDRAFSSTWLPLVVVRRLGLRWMRSLGIIRFLALYLMTGGSGRKPELVTRK